MALDERAKVSLTFGAYVKSVSLLRFTISHKYHHFR